jgi:KDO2-lipid IV(A) lauroyltransferase
MMSRGLVFLLMKVLGYRKSVAIINLSRSFPSLSYVELCDVLAGFREQFSRIIAENIKMLSYSKKNLAEMASVENPEILRRYYDRGKSVIIAGAHIGNWELLAWMDYFVSPGELGYKGNDLKFIYKRQHSRLSDMVVGWTRKSRREIELVESSKVARRILKKSGSPSCYFLFADQAPLPGAKFLLNFMNQPTSMINGPETLARAADIPVVYLEMTRVGGRYKVVFKEIAAEPSTCDKNYITVSYARMVEQTIEDNPSLWLWSHRRWKRKPEGEYVD